MKQQALESMQALSLILLFVTSLFMLRYPDVTSALDTPLPESDRPEERRIMRQDMYRTLAQHCVPLWILSGISAYLVLPQALEIVSSSSFSFWNFDFVLTAFCLLSVWIWILFLWTFYLGIRLLVKAQELEG